MSIEVINRKSGVRYRVSIRHRGRKIPSKTFRRRVDAEMWHRQQLVMRDSGGVVLTRRETLTFGGFFQRFRDEHAQIRQSPGTQKLDKRLYEVHVAWSFNEVQLAKIRRADIEELFRALLKRDVTPKRVNRIRIMLHTIFNYAIHCDLISKNPVTAIRPLPVTKATLGQDINYLAQSEAEILLDWLIVNDPWLYPKVRILINTGIRYGEMMALRVKDFQERTLVISRSFDRHTCVVRDRTKGNKSRLIPLAESMVTFLRQVCAGKAPNDPLLRKTWEDEHHPYKFNQHFEDALAASGIKRIRPHDLRHTFAVHFLENGGHLYSLQQLLGHTSSKLTERYSHFSPAMIDRARGVVDHHRSERVLTLVDGGLPAMLSHKRPTPRDFIETGAAVSVDQNQVN